jgi:hypothetical protein
MRVSILVAIITGVFLLPGTAAFAAKNKGGAGSAANQGDDKSISQRKRSESRARDAGRNGENRAPKADAGHADDPGSDQGREMRERRDERKEIQEEYRGSREPGQEARGDENAGKDTGEPAKKAKKPWYKFWE